MKWTLRDDMIRRFRPPNGGWKYVEGATGWSMTDPMSKDFDAACQVIAAHRKQNPGYKLPFDIPSVAEALIQQTVLRILSDPDNAPKWLVPLDDEAKKKTSGPLQVHPLASAVHVRPVGVVDRILRRVRGLASGLKTLSDWVGDGCVPVPETVANRRSMVCVECPMNSDGDALDSVTGAIGEAIRDQTIVRNSIGVGNKYEDKIRTCLACRCHLPLKVWVPIETIRNRMSDDQLAALDPRCWITNEARVVRASNTKTRSFTRHVTIRRRAAFGDVIAATVLATKLNELGVGVRMMTEPTIAAALSGHPNISEFVFTGTPEVDLDGTYENNLERDRKDLVTLFIEAAEHQLKRLGITPLDRSNRVPVLPMTEEERWAVLRELQSFPRPWVFVVDGSLAWPNRKIRIPDVAALPSILPGSLIWSKPWHMTPKPNGYVPYQILSFRQLMATVSLSDLVISTDTGPMHVATAFNRPLVAIQQNIPLRLRLSNLTDWSEVRPPLDCLECNAFNCPKDKNNPPCSSVSPESIAEAAASKLGAYSNGKTTAIICVLNWAPRVNRCLDAIVGQVDEVIIVGDGSAFIPKVAYAKVKVIPATGNRIGFGKTFMRAARHSTSEFILSLNDDCYVDPGFIDRCKEAMGIGVAVVGALLRYPDGTIQHGGMFRPVGVAGFGHIDHRGTKSRFSSVVGMEAVTLSAALLRREAFFEVRGFDEIYDCYSEDTDLCMKLTTAGWRIVFSPFATAIHDESATTNSMAKMEMLERGNRILSAKWGAYLAGVKPIFEP